MSALKEIQQRLAGACEIDSLRGEAAAAFLYVAHGGRAVEISPHHNGGYWLEFWEADEDPDAGSVRDVTVESAEDAVEETTLWLRFMRR